MLRIMEKRFRKDERVSSKYGATINELIAIYMNYVLNLDLSSSQKLRYFHNFFNGEAERFYKNYVKYSWDMFKEVLLKRKNHLTVLAEKTGFEGSLKTYLFILKKEESMKYRRGTSKTTKSTKSSQLK